MKPHSTTLSIGSGAAGFFLANTAFAQVPGGVVVWGALATQSVPTLSSNVLLGLGLLLSIIAYRILRSKGQNLAMLAAASIAVASVASHSVIIEQARAIFAPNVSYAMGSNGGSQAVPPGSGFVAEFTNSTGSPITILSVTPSSGCSQTPVNINVPDCSPNLVVPNNSSCNVSFSCGSNS